MAYLMLKSFPCRYCKVSVPLEPFAIFHLFDQFGDGCSGLLSDALAAGLLWAALGSSCQCETVAPRHPRHDEVQLSRLVGGV